MATAVVFILIAPAQASLLIGKSATSASGMYRMATFTGAPEF